MKYVSDNERLTLFKNIPRDAYEYIASKMGWITGTTLPTVFAATISEFRFNLIAEHLEYWKRHVAFSIATNNGEFDPEQHMAYFKALNGLLNGPEYIFLNDRKRHAIIEEHKRIGKQIQQQSKAFL